MVAVLGASDPEMDRIEEMLDENNVAYEFAASEGRRVHVGNAYEDADVEVDPEKAVIFVETDVASLEPTVIVDHHRECDPGFWLPPKDSWMASSLGQIARMLAVEPSHQDVVLAAVDHNFGAAFYGEVPGVEVSEVLQCKIEGICRRHDVTELEVELQIEAYADRLQKLPILEMSGAQVIDARSIELPVGYGVQSLSLEIAITMSGRTGLMRMQNMNDPRPKIMLKGYASESQVRYFINEWAPAHGLVDVFGVPVRGYAGGFVETSE